jgi:hypothetical protein
MNKLNFYGEIEEIPAVATWQDIERRAIQNPVLRQAVTMVELGRLTREDALIRVALWAANEMIRNHDQRVDALNQTIPQYFVMPTIPPDPEYK